MESPKPKLSIVYVNYNTEKLLLDSLRSVRENLEGLRYEVIVVDNASAAFDPAPLLQLVPDAIIVRSDENVGFARGNNLGADRAHGEYLWLLNTDTIVPEHNRIEELVAWLDAHPAHGAASPLLLNADGTFQNYQVARDHSLARLVLQRPARRLPHTRIARWVHEDLNGTHERDVEVAVAAALIVRRTAFQETHGFDGGYFFYWDDSDLCKALRQRGHKIRFYTRARVVHLLGQSTKPGWARRRMYFESQDRYWRKWRPGWELHAMRLLRLPNAIYWRLRG